MACISPCPTGSIDNWRRCRARAPTRSKSSSRWDELPARAATLACRRRCGRRPPRSRRTSRASLPEAQRRPGRRRRDGAAVVGGASVRQPATRWRSPTIATVVGNFALTEAGASSDIRHIVLDFGAMPFPVLEGQSIGIVPPGVDAHGTAAPRAPVLGREPARRRAARLQQRLADGEARHRGPRRRSRCAASRRTTCATSRRATPCR